MIDQLPWIIVLIVAAVAVGYVLGRRSAPPAAAIEPVSNAGKPVEAAARPTPARPAPTGGNGPGAVASHGTATALPAGRQAGRPALSGVRSWGYQLQHIDPKRAAASPFDLLVVDYSKDGSEETRLTAAEVERLKVRPDGSRRVVVAYCSIGEAESYRHYWQRSWKRDKPAWLLGENPEWEENYAVCFWDPGWQELVCGKPDALVDRILAQGFDGIYLDKCDVTEDLREHFKAAARSRPNLDGDMAAFVCRISAYAKAKRPDFAVIMQNAEPLLERVELRRAIDAIAKEELLFGLDRPEAPNARADVEESRRRLDLMKRDGKPVFVVEYLSNPSRIMEAAETARRLGYVLYVAPKDRELDRLNAPVLEA